MMGANNSIFDNHQLTSIFAHALCKSPWSQVRSNAELKRQVDMQVHRELSFPDKDVAVPIKDAITQVIFNEPATIIVWADGTKTIAKTMEGDEFVPEIGFAMALCKKAFNSRNEFKSFISQYLPE